MGHYDDVLDVIEKKEIEGRGERLKEIVAGLSDYQAGNLSLNLKNLSDVCKYNVNGKMEDMIRMKILLDTLNKIL